MYFSFNSQSGDLLAVADAESANRRCDGFDVAKGQWRFFSEVGTPLVPDFPDVAGEFGVIIDHGTFRLCGAPGPTIEDVMPQVRRLVPVVPVTLADADRQLAIASRALNMQGV